MIMGLLPLGLVTVGGYIIIKIINDKKTRRGLEYCALGEFLHRLSEEMREKLRSVSEVAASYNSEQVGKDFLNRLLFGEGTEIDEETKRKVRLTVKEAERRRFPETDAIDRLSEEVKSRGQAVLEKAEKDKKVACVLALAVFASVLLLLL